MRLAQFSDGGERRVAASLDQGSWLVAGFTQVLELARVAIDRDVAVVAPRVADVGVLPL